MFSEKEIRFAAARIYRDMPATSQIQWPLLSNRLGCNIWVKHENHTPLGAFKIRGGITYIDWLLREKPMCSGIITATRGNHGQSQARAAVARGLKVIIVVPEGNAAEKNAAIEALGAELIIYGKDFDAAKAHAEYLGQAKNLYMVPSWHPELIRGVATYALELFDHVKNLDCLYVPIGMGSGICGCIAARDALGLSTEIIGVVAKNANAAKLSFDNGKVMETDTANTFADGCAVRIPHSEAFEYYSKGAERIIEIEEESIAEAVRIYWQDTHNMTEGAAALPLAALIQEKEAMQGKSVGLILTGGNMDLDDAASILAGNMP